ncbi:hypothetical protein [Poseidonibacter ostreae]|jgi:predicted membrane channel-forming protein YqfA (hemolysin III family)|uniref:Uncharacterized protein n=1 Tax=Poseidonibacter ostreae TaxID=2654171 RepID=A0ABQ6VQ71_9BACT|nr:hypothetical protein [Poseidonibacter ostreae]KAB7883042.1 hypothetical protein GA417_13275 [Poseidonibacter ostreae]KAB7892916.1 hypothetical protein GBG18_00130 [Poseidonibacter ostreae]MAC82747.1 hypothetical protein [Arcobacter sp.]
MKNEEVKKEFAKVIINAKIVAFLFFILLTPSIVMKVKELDELFGLNEQTWFNAAIAGFVIYMGFTVFLWKCPKCGKFPGRGWFRKECNSCGVELS